MTWPYDENTLLYRAQSPHQIIEFYRSGKDFWLSLNHVLQFHTGECYMSHKYMVQVPIQLYIKRNGRAPSNALVIGGGDGFAAMEFFHTLPDIQLTQVELDATMLDFCKNNPIMKSLNENSFHNPNLKLIAGDGIDYLIRTPERFDIIIDDCDIDVTNQPPNFQRRYEHYKQAMLDKLTPGGIASIMDPLTGSEPSDEIPKLPSGHRERLKWIKERVLHNERLKEWKRRAPGTTYKVANLPNIGPELYIYMPKP